MEEYVLRHETAQYSPRWAFEDMEQRQTSSEQFFKHWHKNKHHKTTVISVICVVLLIPHPVVSSRTWRQPNKPSIQC